MSELLVFMHFYVSFEVLHQDEETNLSHSILISWKYEQKNLNGQI